MADADAVRVEVAQGGGEPADAGRVNNDGDGAAGADAAAAAGGEGASSGAGATAAGQGAAAGAFAAPGGVAASHVVPDIPPKPSHRRHRKREYDWVSIGYGSIVALAIIITLAVTLPQPSRPLRQYYIAAQEVEWNYAPLSVDMCAGTDAPQAFGYHGNKYMGTHVLNVTSEANRIGSTYTKAVYVEYTDDTFTVRKTRRAKWQHLGLLGPVIRASVGDRISVTFRNDARFPASLMPSGVRASKSNEGAHYNDGTIDRFKRDDFLDPFSARSYTCPDATSDVAVRERQDDCSRHTVLSGESFEYVWDVSESAGPAEADASSVVWLYQSHSNSYGDAELHAGLMGPIIISRAGAAGEDGVTAADVDREFVVMFAVTNENQSPLLEANIADHIVRPAVSEDDSGNTLPPGWVSFAHLDKAIVLQKLYKHAMHDAASLSYTDAQAEVQASIDEHRAVTALHGANLGVWFTQPWFDASAYDAVNGGSGTAHDILAGMMETLVNRDDGDFVESNMMHHMNGYMYCGLPGLTMNEGDRVRWHILTVGSEVDMHTPHWHGHTVDYYGHRADELAMLPGGTASVDMTADNPGQWLFHCHVNDHIHGGMLATYTVNGDPDGDNDDDLLEEDNPVPDAGGTARVYYIAAEEEDWDFLPGGLDLCSGTGKPLEAGSLAELTLAPGIDSLGSTVRKARYVEYTDATFTVRKQRPASEEHLGIVGPPLRAEVGDTMTVHFKNNAGFPYSIHPHGVVYTKANEGARYLDGTSGEGKEDDAVAPGDTHVYVWSVPERAGPAETDRDSVVWLYHSHNHEVNDTNAGLVGPIVITRRGAANEDATPRDVDKELIMLFMVFDEVASTYSGYNMETHLTTISDQDGSPLDVSSLSPAARSRALDRLTHDDVFRKRSRRHTINGRVACTLPVPEITVGESVRWHAISLGSEVDVHAPTWLGHSLDYHGHHVASLGLLPSDMQSADMGDTHPGTWAIVDQTDEHVRGGAVALFTVMQGAGAAAAPAFTGEDRLFHIAADEVDWDYAPAGRNLCTGADFSPEENVFMESGVHRIGRVYTKALYREYEDAGFSTLRWGPESRFNTASEHLGLLGPVIRAKAGDRVTIRFRNNLRFPASLKPLGGPFVVAATAVNEVQLAAGSADPVVPGGEVTITFVITSDAAPGPSDPSAVAWIYGSDVDPVADLASGLIGVILVGNAEADEDTAVPDDTGREFVTLYAIFDENLSRYRELNTLKFAADPEGVVPTDEDFKESNKMHTINGYVYCNVPGLRTRQRQSVRFYMLGVGSTQGFHTPFLHGYTFLQRTSGEDRNVRAPQLLPGQVRVVDMETEYAGMWMMHCDVGDHVQAGMSLLLHVEQTIDGKTSSG